MFYIFILNIFFRLIINNFYIIRDICRKNGRSGRKFIPGIDTIYYIIMLQAGKLSGTFGRSL
jgi:hypothetical protein